MCLTLPFRGKRRKSVDDNPPLNHPLSPTRVTYFMDGSEILAHQSIKNVLLAKLSPGFKKVSLEFIFFVCEKQHEGIFLRLKKKK